MTLECINPKDLPNPQTYSQVVVTTGSKMVFVSGQEPEDLDQQLERFGHRPTSRAINISCTSVVPSPISRILLSR